MKHFFIFIFALLLNACTAQNTSKTMNETISTYHFKTKKLQLIDGDLYYSKEGKGEKTLIFLHGLSSNSDAWYRNIEDLKSHYTCIAIDLPGHGKSYKNSEAFTPTYFAKVLNEFSEKMKLEKFVLVGHSMGGQAAIKFATLYPRKVEKLILIAPAGIEEFSDMEATTMKTFTTKDFVKNTTDEQIEKNYQLNFFEMPKEASQMIAERKEAKNASDFDDHALAIEKSVKGMLNDKVINDLPNLEMPVLVLFGKEDMLIPNRFFHPKMTTLEVAKIAENKIPNSEVKLIDKAGHFLQFEKPKEANKEIEHFIQNK